MGISIYGVRDKILAMKSDDRRPAVSNAVFAAATIVLIIIAAAGFGLYATQTATTSTETSTSTTTTTATATGPFTVNLAYKASTGFYLTNATGFTLYFRETDSGNGTSTCTGGCVTAWPLFYAAPGTITLPPGLNASSFGVATRTDGLKQTTYDGYPLYYFVNDKAPGQIAGQGKGGFYPCCSVDATTTPA
jgi:predicted lipoprotein with Yx(FWY)xxD motif